MAQHARQLNITFRRSKDLEEDRRLLGQVCELLRSYEGTDRYSLQVISDERVYKVDFPSYTTNDNPELRRQLGDLLGHDAVQRGWA